MKKKGKSQIKPVAKNKPKKVAMAGGNGKQKKKRNA